MRISCKMVCISRACAETPLSDLAAFAPEVSVQLQLASSSACHVPLGGLVLKGLCELP